MIAEYLVITSIIFLMLGIVWTKNGFINLFIKTLCFILVAWSSYALFGPMNIASTFIK